MTVAKATYLQRRGLLKPAGVSIIAAVACEFNVTLAELISPSRQVKYTIPRHVAAWFLYQSGKSFKEVGRILGGRDHTTIMSSVKWFEENVTHLRKQAKRIRRRIGQ